MSEYEKQELIDAINKEKDNILNNTKEIEEFNNKAESRTKLETEI